MSPLPLYVQQDRKELEVEILRLMVALQSGIQRISIESLVGVHDALYGAVREATA